MKQLFIITFLISAFSCLHAQTELYQGRVVSQENATIKPLKGATIFLFTRDSMLVKSVKTNEKGRFSVNSNATFMKISYVGYEPLVLVLPREKGKKEYKLGDLQLTSVTDTLSEVVVTTGGMIKKIDRKLLFPSASQRDKSADGIELLRNMHLDGIHIKLSDNTFEGLRGGTVTLLINGVAASTNDVMALRPKDVLRIEHIDKPSLRYGDAEAVINVITKRRESGGSVMLSANNAVTTPWGQNYLDVRLNHKKSEFRVNYNGNYKRPKLYNDIEENFNLGSQSFKRISEGDWGVLDMRSHNIKGTYSLMEPDKYYFQTSVSFSINDYPRNDDSGLTYSSIDKSNATYKTDKEDEMAHSPSANIYFQRNITPNQSLTFDFTGTYIDTKLNRSYIETKNGVNMADISSIINGDKYSAIGEIAYENVMTVGRLRLGAKQIYNHVTNEYDGDIVTNTKMRQSYTNFYAEWFGRIGEKASYSAGLGGMYYDIRQGEKSSNKWIFTPTLRVGYELGKRTEINYSGRVMEQSPSLGDLNDVEQDIDTLQIRKGNPELLPYTSYVNSITVSTSAKNMRFIFDITDHYSIDPIMESAYLRGNRIVWMNENQKRWHNIRTTANVSWWNELLYVYARGGLNWIDSKGLDYRNIMRHWFISAGIEATWKKFGANADISNGRMNIIGETIYKRDREVSLGLSYRIKNLQLRASADFSLNRWTGCDENKNKYAGYTKYSYTSNRNMARIRAVWNFEFGRKVKEKRKAINNSDTDSGILNAR